jgi:hypothetical protein
MHSRFGSKIFARTNFFSHFVWVEPKNNPTVLTLEVPFSQTLVRHNILGAPVRVDGPNGSHAYKVIDIVDLVCESRANLACGPIWPFHFR